MEEALLRSDPRDRPAASATPEWDALDVKRCQEVSSLVAKQKRATALAKFKTEVADRITHFSHAGATGVTFAPTEISPLIADSDLTLLHDELKKKGFKTRCYVTGTLEVYWPSDAN